MRIHLLGIGGTGMGSLAGLLLEAGHAVTGSDQKLYPPMSDQLAALGITPFEGYDPGHLDAARPDLVIIGNVIRRDNPEAQEVQRRGLPFQSMAAAFSDFFLTGRTPVVVAGTHGKTTCTALMAWLLSALGEKPGYLVGGVPLNFGKNAARGDGPLFVVEGDEYDTAFFDKGPKFLHYRPQALLLTSIEFDHADIYRDLEHVKGSFRRLVAIMPPDGLIVANADDATVREIVAPAPCRVVTYGLANGDWRPANIHADASGTRFDLSPRGASFLMPLWGMHNVANATGIIALLLESGFPPEGIAAGLQTFKGVRRRQEAVCEYKGVTIIDDFAHHPTAVAKTIESMRLRFPGRRLWAIFEPRSNTSRRNLFREEYIDALAGADRVVLASPFRAEALAEGERFDADGIAAALMRRHVDAHHIPATAHIVEFVIRGVDAGDVILLMSNGGFDGLREKLTAALATSRIVAAGTPVPSSRVPS